MNSLSSNMSLLITLFSSNGVKLKGIRIDCSGRFNGIDRTRTITLKQGIISFNKLDANIVYGFDTSYTKYGSFGIKV
jgi:small subunit ribosomal protein S3